MGISAQKLAASLEALKKLQDQGVIAIQSKDLSRLHRERLIKNGFIQSVIKGWYIPTNPAQSPGESTAWYASFWHFCASYLHERFGENWCLSAEQSLLIHAGNWTVPQQLLVRSPKGRNKVTPLIHETSFFEFRSKLPKTVMQEKEHRLRVMPLLPALIGASKKFFTQYPTDARLIVLMIKDGSELLSFLLEGGHSKIAGRLVGAFRNIGNDQIADDILNTMRVAEYDVREIDPFETQTYHFQRNRELSPYANRLQMMWHEMREDVIKNFPKANNKNIDRKIYLEKVNEIYMTDAYHSLSIEGYRVSLELIERVRRRDWDPDNNLEDKELRNALAARGYWQAFNAVKESIEKILKDENPGVVLKNDHNAWYRELFSPSITAGILETKDLAGYRTDQVYIRNSKHVPPNKEAVRDLMPAFFQRLAEEKNAAVRSVLGHFFFVYIHPYMDGNGRMGRFLMNAMFASGGYDWMVIPVERRAEYMSSLEEASVNKNILPFCEFLKSLFH